MKYMKRFKIAGMFVMSFLSILFVFVGLVTPHSVIVDSEICIIPTHGYNYKTCQQLDYFIDTNLISIPKGYESDLASIPRAFWSIMSPNKSELIAPALIHDLLYGENCLYTRKMADDIFYRALRNNGVSFYDSAKLYTGVRIFGASHFKKCPEQYGS